MAESSEDDTSPERCIDYANKLIEVCDLSFPKISSLHEINCRFFVALFERVTGHGISNTFLRTDTPTDVYMIQAVIDTLSQDIVGLPLSHISGEDIVLGDFISIFNLLEVLEAVFFQLTQNEKNRIITKPASSAVSSTDSEESASLQRVQKRKTSRKMLQKSRATEKKMPETIAKSSHSKRYSDTVDNVKSQTKGNSKTRSRTVKRPHTEDLEELYNSNFEKKVRHLLQSDISPVVRAQQIKKNYIQSLKRPLKRTSITPCNKSYLLPHYLRPKSKSPVKQPHSKRGICKKNIVKTSFSRDIKNTKNDKELPVAIQSILKEFPGFQIPESTSNNLIRHYYQHLGLMHKQLKDILLIKPLTSIQTEEAIMKEEKLSKILEKDLQTSNRIRELQEHKGLENRVKSSLRDARSQSVRIRQYFDEFHKSMSKKMQKRNFSEEVKIEKTFKEILDLQKKKIRLLCDKVKEANEEDAKRHRIYLCSLQNLYEQQLSLLAEKVKAEQKDSSLRNKEQRLVTEKSNQELYKTLKREVRSLQKDVLEMMEDIHFRELDAENLIQSLQ